MKKLLAVVAFVLMFSLAVCTTGSSFDSSKNITVYTRDTTSGTRTGFMEVIGFDAYFNLWKSNSLSRNQKFRPCLYTLFGDIEFNKE